MDKEIKEAMELKNRRILKAINHRDKGIAYFNSVNASIQMSKDKKEIIEWRNWFYENWQNWYIETNELDTDEEVKAF